MVWSLIEVVISILLHKTKLLLPYKLLPLLHGTCIILTSKLIINVHYSELDPLMKPRTPPTHMFHVLCVSLYNN